MEIELIQDGKAVDYNKYQEVIENVKNHFLEEIWIKKQKNGCI